MEQKNKILRNFNMVWKIHINVYFLILTNFTAMTAYKYNCWFLFNSDQCVNWNNNQLQLLAVERWNKCFDDQPTFEIRGDN